MQRKILGIISVDFDAIAQLLIIHSAFVTYLRKKQCSSVSAIYRLLERAILYNKITEFGKPMKLVRVTKTFLTEPITESEQTDNFV
jgi:hypothetical protein